MVERMTLESLHEIVSGTGAALRCRTDLEPAGGSGDKVFPPTYESGKYAVENRRVDGELVPCVLLDSVQSQANRMEAALLDGWERREISLPIAIVEFKDIPKPLRVTSLEAPHRIVDAVFRDSELQESGKWIRFRQSAKGRLLDHVHVRNATAVFELCPTALVFGMWDSTGPRGGLGAKFQRLIVSEIIGINAEMGKKTSSRIDPLQIRLEAGPVYATSEGGWTLNPQQAEREKNNKEKKVGKERKPSEINHGNVLPTIADGGFTIEKAVQTTVISLAGLRRLRFPLDGEARSAFDVDIAARTALLALALCGATLGRLDSDLRSRCLLRSLQEPVWELLDEPGGSPRTFRIPPDNARELLNEAAGLARDAGLPWPDAPLHLNPSADLVELVRRSQELLAKQGEGSN